jgi:hypothetical protein
MKKFFTFLGWPILFAPVAVLWLGIACNSMATNFNHTLMPVVNPICADADSAADIAKDHIHVCADSKTRVKFLVDRFPTDGGILSIGDILQDQSNSLAIRCIALWGLVAFLEIIGVIRKKQS